MIFVASNVAQNGLLYHQRNAELSSEVQYPTKQHTWVLVSKLFYYWPCSALVSGLRPDVAFVSVRNQETCAAIPINCAFREIFFNFKNPSG